MEQTAKNLEIDLIAKALKKSRPGIGKSFFAGVIGGALCSALTVPFILGFGGREAQEFGGSIVLLLQSDAIAWLGMGLAVIFVLIQYYFHWQTKKHVARQREVLAALAKTDTGYPKKTTTA